MIAPWPSANNGNSYWIGRTDKRPGTAYPGAGVVGAVDDVPGKLSRTPRPYHWPHPDWEDYAMVYDLHAPNAG